LLRLAPESQRSRRVWRNVARRRDALVVPRPGPREPRVILNADALGATRILNADALGRAARLRRHT
jgi:hypothetical protein